MGSYDAYSSFGNADGDTWHYGVGLFGKHNFNNGIYTEASLRAGRVKADYDGRDDLGYSGQNWYYGAHGGGGYEYALSKANTLDTYAKVIWTQQESDTVTTNADEKLCFAEMNSRRTRLGSRFIHETANRLKLWGGVAWEYEFDGETDASVDGMRIKYDNELKGHSGLVEAGIEWSAGKAWTMNANVSGMFGQREGVMGQLQANYRF
jgi:outer membrane autotransporter protein